jgi:hypothetical protein
MKDLLLQFTGIVYAVLFAGLIALVVLHFAGKAVLP